MKVKIDLAALKAAAERPDTSHAIVARRFLGDIHLIFSGAAEVEFVPPLASTCAGGAAAA